MSQHKFAHKGFSFYFEGQQIPLDLSCAIFITMNPGYQGRTELPDNLKALFRPVAMMIPNYEMIAEISLYSYGFEKSRVLSIKIIQALKLASEQLSTQSHYDFGMRTVKSIILATGSLIKNNPEEDEHYLVMKAILDCNLPKFTAKDVHLFNAIISDLFPSIETHALDLGALAEFIETSMKEESFVLTDGIREKIIQLYETFQVRHGLMIVGSANSGKSSLLNTLANAVETRSFYETLERMKLAPLVNSESLQLDSEVTAQLASSGLWPLRKATLRQIRKLIAEGHAAEVRQRFGNINKLNYQAVTLLTLNPKAISLKLLYGYLDESGEWHDGIAAMIFRTANEVKQNKLNWVLFDGPVDALWIENMNTVLDDNKKLCLANGETIKLIAGMSIIFEVENLLEASPATVSRCGMVYLESHNLGWEVLFEPWFNGLTINLNTELHREFY